MNAVELKTILKAHKEWVKNNGGCCADLRNADLRYANLRDADLRDADMRYANLRYADLRNADLRDANLCYANLRDADLRDADLRGANLRYADLRNADLRDANLCGANLRYADMCDADLRGADLRDADMRSSNLRYADMCDADMRGSNLDNVYANEGTSFYWISCPETGEFTAYKKCRSGAIVTLLITSDAKRSSATTRKCRASKAVVVSIESKNGEQLERVESNHDSKFVYEVGKTVEVENFDEDRWNECSAGIHFFITRREAELY